MPRAEDRSVAEIYDPEGYPACPFCGSEVEPWQSKIAHGIHLLIERLGNPDISDEEFNEILAALAYKCGAEENDAAA
jgi:hypothetical protein